MKLFAFPLVGQAGLGNSLFPWARAELYASESGARVLAPRWPRIRVGPYLRREPEKRHYRGFFHSPEHLRGFSRFWIQATGERLAECDKAVARNRATASRPQVVEFEGLGELFKPLVGHAKLVRALLWAMTDSSLRSKGPSPEGRFIALHVRRGDLTRQGFTAAQLQDVLQYTPLPWFAAMLEAVKRVEPLANLPILLFTDGDAEEVRPLLGLNGISRPPRQAAVSDLWMMAHAALLFASGFSTFGMWASYLGGMPTVYAPGKIQQQLHSGRGDGPEVELGMGDELPEELAAAVLRHAVPEA